MFSYPPDKDSDHDSIQLSASTPTTVTTETQSRWAAIIPPEILAVIFAHSIEENGTPNLTGNSPLGISHVCSYWRQTALDASHLWRSFLVDISWPRPNRLTIKEECIQPVLELYISRAGNQGLDLTLIDPASILVPDDETLLEILEKFDLPRISPCISELTVVGLSIEDVDDGIGKESLTDWTKLESLTLRNTGEFVSGGISLRFQKTPLLRMLHLHDVAFPVFDAYPWHQLMRLELHVRSPTTKWAPVVRSLTNLEWCMLDFCIYYKDEISPPDTPIVYPRLRFLVFDVYGGPDGTDVWAKTDFPVLETLVWKTAKLTISTPIPRTCLVLRLFHGETYIQQLKTYFNRCSDSNKYPLERLAIETRQRRLLSVPPPSSSAPAPDSKISVGASAIVDAIPLLDGLKELAIGVYIDGYTKARSLSPEEVLAIHTAWRRCRTTAPQEITRGFTLIACGNNWDVQRFFDDMDVAATSADGGLYDTSKAGDVPFTRKKVNVREIDMGRVLGWGFECGYEVWR